MRAKLIVQMTAGLLVSMFVLGCAQNTETPVDQNTKQVTPTTTEQAAAAQGSQVYIYVVNGPGKDDLPNPGDLNLAAAETQLASLASASGAGGGSTGKADAGYIQAGVSLTINTGSTTPSMTGSSTGSGTQSATASAAANPTQEVKPVLEIPVQVTWAGGAGTQQSSATGEGGTTSGQSQTSDLKTAVAQVKAAADKLAELTPLLDGLLNPTSQPASE